MQLANLLIRPMNRSIKFMNFLINLFLQASRGTQDRGLLNNVCDTKVRDVKK